MLLRRAVFFVLFCYLPVLAQSPTLTGSLETIRVEGVTTDQDLVTNLIRTYLKSRPGIPVSQIDLEEERNLVYSIGDFSEVTVSLEDRGSGPELIVRVRENPRINEVRLEGLTVADPSALTNRLAETYGLEPGSVLNTLRVEEAVTSLQRSYRQSGFPFDVPISLEVVPLSEEEVEEDSEILAGDTPVDVVFTVTENVPLREVVFEGNTVLDDDTLEEIFDPLVRTRTFDIAAYSAATSEINARYRELGYRDSGVNPEATRLVDGTLQVNLRELRIGSYDTTAIGVDPAEFTLQAGDLYNYDVILEDIRRLAQGRTTDIAIQPPLILSSGDVRISFRTDAPETAGPVDAVQIEGNTVIPTEDLLEVLRLGVGDTFTSALAIEDFASIVERYTEAGYAVSPQPNFNYLDGTYVQRITELKIAGYRVVFEEEGNRSRDFIITRYLPEIGKVLNLNDLDAGLRAVARLGAVQPLTRQFEPTDSPGEVTVVVAVRELRTGTFQPGLEYDTLRGFSAAVTFGDTNFLGRGHNFDSELTAQTSDVGFLLGGRLSYSVPWLYIDALDFKRVPTSLSGSIFSTLQTNEPLTQDGEVKVCLDPADRASNSCPAEERVYVGEYTRRDSGLGFSIGRQILPDTTLRVAARGTYSEYKLEPTVPCVLEDGKYTPANCSLPREGALPNVPQSGLSAGVTSTINFDNRDNPDFPRQGVAANASVGIGFGNDFRDGVGQQRSYSYFPVEFGVKTYLALADLFPNEVTDTNHVFAFKLNAGHQFGAVYPTDKYFRVGNTLLESTLIRGFERDDFNPSKTYAIGTVEYRYDFGLSTVATQTVVGIVFVDVGWASNVPGYGDYSAPFFAGAGVGVQVNLGFTALGYFPLRFDYGISQRHPGGVFSFRVGPVF